MKKIGCMLTMALAMAFALAANGASSAVPCFVAARPVWPEGRERRMNDFVEFRASFDAKKGDDVKLRVAGSSVYRIRLNGEFAGYGPARAAKGFFRVDEWPLEVKDGRNELSVEVSAYNCNNFYIPDQGAFLQAEVVSGGRVLAATGRDFSAHETPRVVKCSRYSFQRAFGEAYRLSPGWTGAEIKLAEQPQVRLLERIAPYPKFDVIGPLKPIARTKVAYDPSAKYRSARWVDSVGPFFKCYAEKDLDVNIWRELQRVRTTVAETNGVFSSATLRAGEGAMYDVGLNSTGFAALDVECRKAGTLWFAFDEILSDGVVNPTRFNLCGGAALSMAPGRHSVELFEPNTMRYVHLYTLDGEFDLGRVALRTYRSPAADKASMRSSDPEIDAIFAAARETFAQNAVDVFTDCPSRERAGWLCDSFFIGRASALLTGSTELERLFIQNYLLPGKFDDVPDGMLPMCYPSDHTDRKFIPNWAMWFVIEVAEYLDRSGDRATVDALKPRLMKLKDYLWRFRNSDGLLERLPSWVFVEWSEANKLVRDVSYPSNATWAEVLDSLDRMYSMPELAEEAERVRDEIRRQAWNGKWFCDNAVRGADGRLALSGKCTETCQYYMFMFKVATEKTYPGLWRTLLADFGPDRRKTGKHPEIFFSNAFIGNFLRLELLSRAGLARQLLDETKGFFGYMAERTGTLWENVGTNASCNHGFASYVAVLYLRNVLGIEMIDQRSKTVVTRDVDVPLDFCEATLPVADGTVTFGWRSVDGRRETTFRAL